MRSKILILCTGNSCRSQMAEGILRSLDPELQVSSAGTDPALYVHPKAIQVMEEVGIDISHHKPRSVNVFLKEPFDYVITVCDDAKECCPVFGGTVKKRIHIGFDDPSWTRGSEEYILSEFRRVRDEIMSKFQAFYHKSLRRTTDNR